jgi:hypothetical protein
MPNEETSPFLKSPEAKGRESLFSRTARGLLMIGAILNLAASPRSTIAQQKADTKPQEKQAEASPSPHKLPPTIRASSRLS